MFTPKPIEELFDLHQNGQLSWLELVQQGEYQQEFNEWCEECGLSASDDTAFLFLEKKESDSLNAAQFVDLKLALV